jgi:hypothetical protein
MIVDAPPLRMSIATTISATETANQGQTRACFARVTTLSGMAISL